MNSRPVWLTREQRDRLAWRNDPIAKQWDAAPADLVESVVDEVLALFAHPPVEDPARFMALGVLRALGMPE